MVPKFTRMPDAELAAIASVCAVCVGVEAEQLRRGDGRAERADRARRVEALLVVIRVNRLGDLALDLEAGEERLEELRARRCAARSPTASAAASGGMVGCVSRPKMRSALVASCVSSQSSAWPLVPLTSAAEAAPVLNGCGPNTVAAVRGSAPCTCSCRMRPASCVEPASMTPRPSMMQRLPIVTASSGKSASRAFWMKSTTAPVAVLVVVIGRQA